MSTLTFSEPIRFDLPPSLEATEPPELTLGRRDAVRLMVSRDIDPPIHAHAHELARFLDPGDLVVINTSATVPAAVDAAARGGEFVIVHFSTELPTGLWLVELRRPVDGDASQPHDGDFGGTDLRLPGRATVHVLGRMPGSARLWVASLDLGEPIIDYLHRWGRAIRYHYVPATWPIDAYRNAYAADQLPAGRPLHARARRLDRSRNDQSRRRFEAIGVGRWRDRARDRWRQRLPSSRNHHQWRSIRLFQDRCTRSRMVGGGAVR